MSKYRNMSEKAYRRGYQVGRLRLRGRVTDKYVDDIRFIYSLPGLADAFNAGLAAPVLRDNIEYHGAFWTPAQRRFWEWENRR